MLIHSLLFMYLSSSILSLGAHRIVEKVVIRHADAVFEFGGVCPTEFGCLADIQELARGTVGTRRVPLYATLISHHFRHQFGQRFDSQFLACTGIDGLIARVVIHEEYAEVRQVVHIQELTQRTTVAPTGDLFCPTLLGLVEAADECR